MAGANFTPQAGHPPGLEPWALVIHWNLDIGRWVIAHGSFRQSFAAFGSSASRNPSPRKLREKSVMEKASPGKTSSHGYSSMLLAPSVMRVPHELIGGCTPKPRKLRNASSSMTLGTVSVV